MHNADTRGADSSTTFWIVAAVLVVVVAAVIGAILVVGLMPPTATSLPGQVELRIFRVDAPPPEYPPVEWTPDSAAFDEEAARTTLEFYRAYPDQDEYGYSCIKLALEPGMTEAWDAFTKRNEGRWASATISVEDVRANAGIVRVAACTSDTIVITPLGHEPELMSYRVMDLIEITRRRNSDGGFLRRSKTD